MVQARAGSGNTIGVMVRMPESLRDLVRTAAEENGRSMNSEIIDRLNRSLLSAEEHSAISADAFRDVLDDLLAAGIIDMTKVSKDSAFYKRHKEKREADRDE